MKEPSETTCQSVKVIDPKLEFGGEYKVKAIDL